MSDPIHIISLGAGVQSSAMAIMACHGLIKPMPDCAMFADTGDETRETYLWIKELSRLVTFPVISLKGPRLSDMIVNEWGHSQIPAFYLNKKGEAAIGRRQCTKYFKVIPIRRELRVRYPGRNIVLWQGISLDELSRMKDSGRQWLEHRFPLIELRKTRGDCDAYLKTVTSWRVPKSACVYCPFKEPARWRESTKRPEEMATINRVEAVLTPRNEYLTPKLKPISHIDFSSEEDRGQVNMFNNECEGMCGV
ncbi:MAG TPA: hypothetical protein VJ521_05355 [Acidobacteriota bacterium]|nr:hypothetical protein [Acidobacteriota bacterium]